MNCWVNRNEAGRRCHNQQKHYRKEGTTKQREGKVRKRANLCEARQLQHNSADFSGLLRSILLKSQERRSWLFLSRRGGQIYSISTFKRWSNVCFSSAFPLHHSPPSPVTLGFITRTLSLSLLVMIIWPCQQVEVTELSISLPSQRISNINDVSFLCVFVCCSRVYKLGWWHYTQTFRMDAWVWRHQPPAANLIGRLTASKPADCVSVPQHSVFSSLITHSTPFCPQESKSSSLLQCKSFSL